MKQILIILFLLIGMPCFANISVCNTDYCVSVHESKIDSIYTTQNPDIGVIVKLNNEATLFVYMRTKRQAYLSMCQAYYELKDTYMWADEEFERRIKQGDKAKFKDKDTRYDEIPLLMLRK